MANYCKDIHLLLSSSYRAVWFAYKVGDVIKSTDAILVLPGNIGVSLREENKKYREPHLGKSVPIVVQVMIMGDVILGECEIIPEGYRITKKVKSPSLQYVAESIKQAAREVK